MTLCAQAQMQSRAALQAFLKDSPANVSHTMSLALTRALARIIPSCDPAFREDGTGLQLTDVKMFCSVLCSHLYELNAFFVYKYSRLFYLYNQGVVLILIKKNVQSFSITSFYLILL